jgi:DNA adenine methylase
LVKSPQLSPPLKWHGGKHYLASRIIELMPLHTHYVEPYFGGGAVLLAKNPEGVSEVVNDLNRELTNFWRVLQDDDMFAIFLRRVQATPFSEAEFNRDDSCPASANDSPKRAAKFFVRCRQSLAGRMDVFAPLSRTRTRRAMNEQAAAWLSAIEGLPVVHTRLARVVILCRDALDVIRQQDGPDTFFYVDPPYLPGTRTAPSVYSHEMTDYDHGLLLSVLGGIEGKFLLSGYHNKLYNDAAERYEWRRTDFDLPNHAAGGAVKRRMIESVWMNY